MKTFILSILLLTSFFSFSQNQAGSIHYKIVMKANGGEMPASEMSIIFKGGKSRVDANMMMMKTTVITDEKTVLTIFEGMGTKGYSKKAKDENTNTEKTKPTAKINYTTETKTILGYECKKAEVTTNDQFSGEVKYNLWFCEKLPSIETSFDKMIDAKLKGMCLLIEGGNDQMSISITADKVSAESPEDSKFIFDLTGYTEMETPMGF